MTPNKYTLEDIILAWEDYTRPFYVVDKGSKVEAELQMVDDIGTIIPTNDPKKVEIKSNQDLGIQFPAYLVRWIEGKKAVFKLKDTNDTK